GGAVPAPVAAVAAATVPRVMVAATAAAPPALVAARAALPATRLPASMIAARRRFIVILIFVFIVLSFPLIACLCSMRLSTSASCSLVHRWAASCGQRAGQPPDRPARTARSPPPRGGGPRGAGPISRRDSP